MTSSFRSTNLNKQDSGLGSLYSVLPLFAPGIYSPFMVSVACSQSWVAAFGPRCLDRTASRDLGAPVFFTQTLRSQPDRVPQNRVLRVQTPAYEGPTPAYEGPGAFGQYIYIYTWTFKGSPMEVP